MADHTSDISSPSDEFSVQPTPDVASRTQESADDAPSAATGQADAARVAPVGEVTEPVAPAEPPESAEATEQEANPPRWGRVIVVLLLAVVLALGGWLLWLYVVQSELIRRSATSEVNQLRDAWVRSARNRGDAPRMVKQSVPGKAYWTIRIPALPESAAWPVVAGVAHLDRGVGWYSTTAQPGQIGNCVISGHRVTHGEPFAGWEKLKAGDQVLIESVDATYTYTLLNSAGQLTVDQSAAWVMDSVPGRHEEPHQALLTLITHEDLIPTADRAVLFGVLTHTELK